MKQNSKALYWVWLSLCFPPACERLIAILEETDPETFYHEKTAYPFLKPADLTAVQTISLERAELAVRRCEKAGGWIVTIEDEDYPESLLHIYCPPPVLYVRGDISCLRGRLAVAVVGTRRAYPYYSSTAGNISYQLAQSGAAVISACAVGIDSYAHLGCMRGGGPTVGVLACGIYVDYPKDSHDLKESIVATGGALVTELEPGRRTPAGYFHARNRLIAGLADCVLLGQVPLRSGAMITANAAIDQGKDIFCIPPHSVYDSQCLGAAGYIRDGARVVFSAYDIVTAYTSQYPNSLRTDIVERQPYFIPEPLETGEIPPSGHKKAVRRKERPQAAAPEEPEKPAEQFHAASAPAYQLSGADDGTPRGKVLALLSDEPRSVDDLSAACGLPAGEILQMLTELELEGTVEAVPGQRFKLSS